MGNKTLLTLTFVLISSMLYAQISDNRTFYDVTNDSPVFDLFYDGSEIKAYYYGIKDTVDTNVNFNGGAEHLIQYFDSLYFASFEERNYVELNRTVLCSLLFDENLKIQEIRFLNAYSSKDLVAYHKLIKDILLSSEGKWHKKYESDRWSLFLYPIRLK